MGVSGFNKISLRPRLPEITIRDRDEDLQAVMESVCKEGSESRTEMSPEIQVGNSR